MRNRRLMFKTRATVWTIALLIVLAAASAAHAQFNVPDACRQGTGTYSGTINGEAIYKTCTKGGIEYLDLFFDDAYGFSATDYSEVTGYHYTEIAYAADGSFVIDGDFNSIHAQNTLHVEGRLSGCTITGTFTITDSNDDNESGTFVIEGGVQSENCVYDEPAGGNLCGSIGGAALAVPFCIGTARRRRK